MHLPIVLCVPGTHTTRQGGVGNKVPVLALVLATGRTWTEQERLKHTARWVYDANGFTILNTATAAAAAAAVTAVSRTHKSKAETHTPMDSQVLTRPAPLTVKWPPSAKRFPSLRETSK